MINKCSKIGFLVCMLALLIIICTWSHMNDPALVKNAVMQSSADVAEQSNKSSVRKTADDRDGDGISDAAEKEVGLNQELSDTDGDNKLDGEEGIENDRDHDGIIDALESALDDSDLDGVPDEYDSENANPDNDTDGDGYGNGLERAEGSDPLDAKSKPADHDKDGIPDNIDADGGPISFNIVKEGDSIAMEGSLANILQISSLKEAFDKENIFYKNGVIMKDSGLEDKPEAINLATKIAPLFLAYYKNGTIKYKDNTFELSGEVSTVEQKNEIAKFLADNAGLTHYVNDTKVPESALAKPNDANKTKNDAKKEQAQVDETQQKKVNESTQAALGGTDKNITKEPEMRLKPKTVENNMPISFIVNKDDSVFTLDGIFANIDQISQLQNKFDDEGILYRNGILELNRNLEGDSAIVLAQKLIPHLARNYKKGAISYKDGVMTITGEVPTENDKNTMERLLAVNAMGIQYANKTVVVELPVVTAEEKRSFASEIEDLLMSAKITFETGSARLTSEGLATVDKVGDILSKYKDIRLELAGYTDSDGDDNANQKLSQSRVESVMKALLKHGIDPFRLRAKGYGESDPVAPNDSAENKAKNRRVEFHIIGE